MGWSPDDAMNLLNKHRDEENQVYHFKIAEDLRKLGEDMCGPETI